MSDIERICEINHERRKWAEEYDWQYTDFGQVEIATEANDKRGGRKRQKVLRTVCTACTMAAGGGAAFVGMGIVMGHWLTVVLSTLIAAVFLLTGCRAEGMLEDCREGRGDHV